MSNRRLRGAGFSLGLDRKPNQTSIRGLAGDPQEFLPAISISDSHGEGVPAFPRCYPSLLSQDSLQPVPTTEPPSLLPWRNWLDAILRRAGWNSLQIAILSQSTAARSSCASRKSVIGILFYIFFASFSFWKMKGFVGKDCSGCISQFGGKKEKKTKKIGHNDQSGLF